MDIVEFLGELTGITFGLAAIGHMISRAKPDKGYRKYFISELKKAILKKDKKIVSHVAKQQDTKF